MNKNTVIGLVLIFSILIGYMYFTQPSKEEIRERIVQDSLNRAKRMEQNLKDSIAGVDADSLKNTGVSATVTEQDTTNSNTPVTDSQSKTLSTGPFAQAAESDDSYYLIESDLLRIRIASKGGRPVEVELKDYKTFDTLPLILYKEKGSDFSLGFFSGRQRLQTRDYQFVPFWYDSRLEGLDSIVIQNDTLKFGMRLYADVPGDSAKTTEKPYIEFLYTLVRGSYMVGFDIHFNGMQNVIAQQTDQMDLTWKTHLLKQEQTSNMMNGSTIYYSLMDKSVDYLSESKDDELSELTHLKWLSFKQAFFTSVLIAENYFSYAEGNVSTDKKSKDDRYLRTMEATLGIPYKGGDTGTINLNFYFGPNKYSILRSYKLALERQIPLGWSFFLMQWINRGAVLPVFNWLEKTGMNYGIIILILTLLLKLVLFPIAYKMYVSSAKMRALKPEVDEINKKFPKKEDAMKKQQAVMALYKSVGVNLMAGCVPMLLQFPILLAMFRFFPASIELRQQSFLWAHDLSSYDSILDLGFNIPFYGDHVSLFTLLMTISTIIYTRLNNQMMSGSTQMPGMKLMMYLMPVMFLGIFNNYASGLSYYYLLANLITFGQMAIMRQFVDDKKLRAKLQANKQKPVRKSRFQQRLEEAAKQRGYKPTKK